MAGCLNPTLKGKSTSSSSTSASSGSLAWSAPLAVGSHRISAPPYFPVELNNSSQLIKLSYDGHWAAFQTFATNWGGTDTNADRDVFAVNLKTKQLIHVNSTSAGVQSNSFGSLDPTATRYTFSPDNRYVLFQSQATNLVGGTIANQSVYSKDLQTGAVALISSSSAGVQSNIAATFGSFSPDGTKVYFNSNGTNLVGGDTNGVNDVFEKNLLTGVTTRVSTTSAGAELNVGAGGGSYFEDITSDGRYLLFSSGASNVVAGDTNNQWDVFRKDLQTGTVIRVSFGTGSVELNGYSGLATFYDHSSPDKVIFTTQATNHGYADANGARDVFLRDIVADTTVLISANNVGIIGNQASSGAGDAVFGIPSNNQVLFISSASNLLAGDPSVHANYFIKDIVSGTLSIVDQNTSGVFPIAPGGAAYPHMNFNGKVIGYSSTATDIVAGDVNGQGDIFVRVYP